MFIENNKAKTIRQLRELLSKQAFLLCVILFCTLWSMKAAAQNQSVTVRKETKVFTSYVLLLEQENANTKILKDSLRIFVPFQDIEELEYSIVNGELFVVYESNGTSRITRGTTVTILRYGLKESSFVLDDSITIAKGANPAIRAVSFSIDKNFLKLTNKNQQIKMYDISSQRKYLELANDIIKYFSNT
jgi:hypothetical protein